MLMIRLSGAEPIRLAREVMNRPGATILSIALREGNSLKVKKTRGTSLHLSNFKYSCPTVFEIKS